MPTEVDSTTTTTQETYPDGIIHMFDNVFKVRHDLIEFADDGIDPESTEFVYQNPRHIVNGAQPMGKGGTKEEMATLREAIRSEGLKHPLDCRWLPDHKKIQLVGGSRRKRSIDKLRAENAKCYNPVTSDLEPATGLYEYIVCHINEMDDETALKHAISSNEEGRPIGEGALAALVRHLRKCGKSDDQIRWTLSKSVAWLRQTDEILQLDSKCFNAFCTEEINRTVALKLVSIPDVKRRLQLFGDATKEASARIQANIKKHDEQIEKAKDEEELLEGEARAAEVMGKPATKARKKVSVARDRIAQHEKAKDEVGKKRTNRVIAKDLAAAAKKNGEDNVDVRPLTATKVKKEWLSTVTALIAKKGTAEDGTEYDLDHLYCAQILLKAYLQGEEKIEKVLKIIARNQDRRTAKK